MLGENYSVVPSVWVPYFQEHTVIYSFVLCAPSLSLSLSLSLSSSLEKRDH